jgi:uncharacterized damage-inducible protein DinB
MELLDRLLGHDHWTTARVLELGRELSDDQLDQSFDIGHRTLRATFEHMIVSVEGWAALMTGEPDRSAHPFRDEPYPLALPELNERHDSSYAAFAALARRLTGERRLNDTFVDHYRITQTFGATILQVILHNHQHRSEALHILQRLGVPDLPDGDPQEWEHLTHRTEPFW